MKLAVIGVIHLGCSDYTDKRISDFSEKFVEAVTLALGYDISDDQNVIEQKKMYETGRNGSILCY